MLFENLAEEIRTRHQASGIAVAIIDAAGNTCYEKYFGYRDQEAKLPIDPDTIFGVASVTKSFTALAIMQMAERGLIDLDAPVSRYVPEFTNRNQEPVKVWHFLCHCAGFYPVHRTVLREVVKDLGLPETMKEDPAYDEELAKTGARIVSEQLDAQTKEHGLIGRPGEYMSYCNDGFALLSEIIRRYGGEPSYADYIKKNILDPLGMSRSGCDYIRPALDQNAAILYKKVKGVMEGRLPDVALRKNDVLVIPSIHELQERGAFTVNGQVARPGVYPYAENTTLEDLIIQAGGLLEGASTVKVDVSRRLKDPKSTIPSNEIGKVYTFSLKDGFVIDGDPGFILEPFDVVEVRRSPGYQPQRQVSILGEVAFPGGYTLIRKNERLSDLIERAGGITNDAYVRGGRLIRRMTDEERAVRDAVLRTVTQNQESDSVAVGKLNLSDFYSVGIELDKALANPGSDYDVVLREGDRLVVPEHVSTVRIQGEVMYPNTVVYIEGQPLKYYISQAGGYGQRAKRNRAYVVYMNGTVARVKANVIIEPGCEIIVPSKRAREKFSISEILGLTTSAASVGTMAATIANLFK